tara:strand:+ start:50 stop:325 length:276 start_codon:yes stop_codon:yes gene_type:complete
MKGKENYLTKGERAMGFKIEKDIKIVNERATYRTEFTQALNNLEVGDLISGLSKVDVYKYRVNFYTKNFKDRKFQFWKDPETKRYRIQRIG